MRKYRGLMPIVLIVLMVASWYMLISDASKTEETYNNYLTQARKYAEDGITKYAIENYNQALEIKNDVDIYVEVANYYKEQQKANFSKRNIVSENAHEDVYDTVILTNEEEEYTIPDYIKILGTYSND